MLIKLTRVNGKIVLINIDDMTYINTNETGSEIIKLISHITYTWDVKESPEEILAFIKQAESTDAELRQAARALIFICETTGVPWDDYKPEYDNLKTLLEKK